MGMVESPYRDYDMAHAEIKRRAETLLDPELLQFHLTATLRLALPFSGFFKFLLHGTAGTRMLEFNLRLHGPALPEIVSQIDDGMRDIETSMLLAHMGRCR